MDIRYNFLNTLDHFPCELIRTLWTLQSLDTTLDGCEEDGQDQIAVQMENQADFLQDLVRGRIRTLELQRNELLEMQEIRKRYDATRSRDPSKNAPLTIKLNLRKSQSSSGSSKNRVSKVSRGADGERKPNITRREEPQEEKYCVCQNVSYGSMIACDNGNCPIEWFHYGCVGIVRPLGGKWFCSKRCKKEAKKKGSK